MDLISASGLRFVVGPASCRICICHIYSLCTITVINIDTYIRKPCSLRCDFSIYNKVILPHHFCIKFKAFCCAPLLCIRSRHSVNDQLFCLASIKASVMDLRHIFSYPYLLQQTAVTKCICSYGGHAVRKHHPLQIYAFKCAVSDHFQCCRQDDPAEISTVFEHVIRKFLHAFRHCDALQLTVTVKDAFPCTAKVLRIIDAAKAGAVCKTVLSKCCNCIWKLDFPQACAVIKSPVPYTGQA